MNTAQIFWLIGGPIILLGTWAIVWEVHETRREKRERRAQFLAKQAERKARWERFEQWQAHGARQVGPYRQWWSIPGGVDETKEDTDTCAIHP